MWQLIRSLAAQPVIAAVWCTQPAPSCPWLPALQQYRAAACSLLSLNAAHALPQHGAMQPCAPALIAAVQPTASCTYRRITAIGVVPCRRVHLPPSAAMLPPATDCSHALQQACCTWPLPPCYGKAVGGTDEGLAKTCAVYHHGGDQTAGLQSVPQMRLLAPLTCTRRCGGTPVQLAHPSAPLSLSTHSSFHIRLLEHCQAQRQSSSTQVQTLPRAMAPRSRSHASQAAPTPPATQIDALPDPVLVRCLGFLELKER